MVFLLRFVFSDLLGAIVRFPVWWYGTGFFGLIEWFQQELALRWRSMAISLWVKSFFVPMYGANDIWGRIISIIMRFVVLVFRLIAFVLEILVDFILCGVWLIAPVVFLAMLLLNIWNGFFV